MSIKGKDLREGHVVATGEVVMSLPLKSWDRVTRKWKARVELRKPSTGCERIAYWGWESTIFLAKGQ